MKLIILAGGKGTRLSEETILKPKPLVLVGGMPIIWHIMKHYSKFGVNEFIICLGYKGNLLKEYFANYHLLNSDIEIDTTEDSYKILKRSKDKWKIKLIDTGENTLTGGRIKKVLKYVANDEYFALTYGDGVSNIDINKQLIFHKKHKKIATMSLVRPPGRFGAVVMQGNNVDKFIEKPQGDGSWVNGGFFILSPKIREYIKGLNPVWEKKPLENLSKDKKLAGYFHKGFWYAMDTLRDQIYLDNLWNKSKAPWKTWND